MSQISIGLKNSILFRETIIYTAADILGKSIPFILLPFLTAHLSTNEYGIVSNYQTLFTILIVFVTLGTPSYFGTGYYSNSIPKNNNIAFSLSLLYILIACLLVLVVFIFHQQIQNLLELSLKWQLLALVIALFNGIARINSLHYRLSNQAYKFAAFEIGLTIINFSLSVALIYFYKMALEGRILGLSISYIFIGILGLIFLLRRNNYQVKPDYNEIKNALKFGIPLIPHTLSSWLRSGLDRVIITATFGAATVGIYAAGFQLGLVLFIITVSFNKAFAPYLYKELKNISEGKKRFLVKLSYLYFVGILLLAMLIWFVEYNFVIYFLNEKYRSAIDFIPWILFSFAFQGMYFMVVNYIFYTRKTKVLAFITFFTSFLHIILGFWLIPLYGSLVAAQLFLIVNILTLGGTWYYSNKIFPMPWNIFKTNS